MRDVLYLTKSVEQSVSSSLDVRLPPFRTHNLEIRLFSQGWGRKRVHSTTSRVLRTIQKRLFSNDSAIPKPERSMSNPAPTGKMALYPAVGAGKAHHVPNLSCDE